MPTSYFIVWIGQFLYLQRMQLRPLLVAPLILVLIFLLLVSGIVSAALLALLVVPAVFYL
jgi:Cu/Ag efflux pump CusA